jgi:hypothetical protein
VHFVVNRLQSLFGARTLKLYLRGPTDEHGSYHLVNEKGEFITDQIKGTELYIDDMTGVPRHGGEVTVHVYGTYKEKNCGDCIHSISSILGQSMTCSAPYPEWAKSSERKTRLGLPIVEPSFGTNCKMWQQEDNDDD